MPGEIPVKDLQFPSGGHAILSWGLPSEFVLFGNGVFCNVYILSSDGRLLYRQKGDLGLEWFQTAILPDRAGDVLLFSTSGGVPIGVNTEVLRILDGKVETILSMNAAIVAARTRPDKSLSTLVLRVPVRGEGPSTDRWKNVTMVWNATRERFQNK